LYERQLLKYGQAPAKNVKKSHFILEFEETVFHEIREHFYLVTRDLAPEFLFTFDKYAGQLFHVDACKI
jgi:hypothetical protein